MPIGRYRLRLARPGAADGLLHVPESVSETLPLWVDDAPRFLGRVELSPDKRLTLIVEAPLPVEARGQRRQRALQMRQGAATLPLRESTVLFRTFYGENTSDSALRIHEEITRRRLGLTSYWAVRDASVAVPAGGIPVVVNSPEWYDLLSTAEYLVENVHQPDFLVKRPGQKIVQTLHGYPFKVAGLPYWEQSGYSAARIESFLRRQAEWDFLVSPAPYATPLLVRDFAFDGTVLEIGYPRNDVFFAPDAPDLRERTRRLLGARPDQTVVLYAPTYRDNLSSSEFRADMVDFFDAQAASRALGGSFLFLIRGHAMNARTSFRTSGDSCVVDVTDYPEISELCLAADVALLDYSSLRFDFGVSGKPMLFLVPDLEQYRDASRGWLMPYEPTAPGPMVDSTGEVVEHLRDLDRLTSDYASAREEFRATYLPLEDGKASARFVDAVFTMPEDDQRRRDRGGQFQAG